MNKLEELLEQIDNELEEEVENLMYLLDHQQIEDINLININYKIRDLLIKRDELRTKLYYTIIKDD